MNTRALASQLMVEVLTDGHSLSQCLPKAKNLCKKPEDAAFLQALVFGTLRFYPRLAFISRQLLKKPIKLKEIDCYYLILIGLYQLVEMHVPPHAAIAETVEAARVLNKPWTTGLINAVLRSYQRQSQTLLDSIYQNEEAEFAHPQWLIDIIKRAWPTEFETILIQNNTQAPCSLRVNIQKTSRQRYIKLLEKNDILADPILVFFR